ncbi:STAS domain-containing protein [Streptomyces rimosus]|uniref:STAS domain-containing protein n=1 Tax=Streptomyces rimosus TaxID=1927 RepID=UPI0031D451FC
MVGSASSGEKVQVISAYALRMTCFFRQGHTVLILAGELDPYNWPDFRRVLNTIRDEGEGSLIVVAAPRTYLDSTNLGALARVMKTLRAGDPVRTVHLVAPDSHSYVNRLLRTAGLTRVFPLHATLESALAAVSGHETDG